MNLSDPAFRDGVMRCVRCSICVPKCPSYAVFKNEADSPRGRVQMLRAVMEKRLVPDATLEHHLDRCLGCRACEDVCPSGVPYGKLLDHARKELLPTPYAGFRKKMTNGFLNNVLVWPGRLAFFTRLLWLAQVLRLDRLARWVVRIFSKKTARRIDLLPRVAGAPLDLEDIPIPEQPTAAFHAGCLMAKALGDVQRSALRVLDQNGYATVVPREQRCCGALHLHTGLEDDAKQLARETIAAFDVGNVPICTTSAGCALAMKEYGKLLADDPDWAARAKAFSARVKDLSEMVGKSRAPEGKIGVQEACHHWNVQQVRGKALDALQKAGADAVALPRGIGCCGAAGLWSANHPEPAWELLQPLLDSIETTKCDAVAISNPGCLFHIRAGLRARGSSVRALHVAELLDPKATAIRRDDDDE